MIETIALNRLGVIVAYDRHDKEVTEENLIDYYTFKLELMNLGVHLKGAVDYYKISTQRMQEVLSNVRKLRGGDVNYVPLFANFPQERPDDLVYLTRRVMGLFGLNTFDMANYGADPISQMGNLTLWSRVAVAQELKLQDRKSKWITLTLQTAQETYKKLEKWVEMQVYSPVAVQEVLWPDITECCNILALELDVSRIVCKETLAIICVEQFHKFNRIVGKTATDALRMFAVLKQQDVTLTENVSFSGLKLSKPQRRGLMEYLNKCSGLEEDLLRYAPLWKAMAAYIHPQDYVKVAPKAARAFKNLKEGKIQTFDSKWKNAGDAHKLQLLSSRPGTFIRNLTYVLKSVNAEQVASALLNTDLSKVPITTLLSVYSLLNYKAQGLTNADRLFIVKSGKFWAEHNETQLEALQLEAITDSDKYTQVRSVLYFELLSRLKQQEVTDEVGEKEVETTSPIPSVSSLIIEPELEDIVLPLQVRKMSESMLQLAPGSAISIDHDTEVLRLHVYWHENSLRTDLDHSAIYVNEALENMGSISFNSYGRQSWIMHSGDIQNAPHGAVEYIDVVLKYIPSNVRYIIFQVLNYTKKNGRTGEEFNELKKCYYGWQERKDTDKNTKQYSVNTVGNNFIATGKGVNWTPVIYDVKSRKIIVVDLFGRGASMIQNNKYLPTMIGAMKSLRQIKPTYSMLLDLYAKANAIDVLDKFEEVREDTITFDMQKVGKVREELLTDV